MYITTVEQPAKGGTIRVTNSSCAALSKSHGYEVAQEGDKLIVNVDTRSNYEVVNVYNSKDKKQPLSKDDKGNYYINVPKGGVYISAELKSTAEPQPEPTKKAKKTLWTTVKAKGNKSLVFKWKKFNGADDYESLFSRCNPFRVRAPAGEYT